MKTLLLASTFAILSTVAIAAPPVGSCLGGCLSTASAAPTPVFPVDYQCKVNWPLADGLGSCIINDESPLIGAKRNPHSMTVTTVDSHGVSHTHTYTSNTP